jgi:hypothetical protein
VGPFEAASLQVLLSFGVDTALAGAFTVALHVLLLGPVIIVGLVLLWLSEVTLNQIMGVPKSPAGTT